MVVMEWGGGVVGKRVIRWRWRMWRWIGWRGLSEDAC